MHFCMTFNGSRCLVDGNPLMRCVKYAERRRYLHDFFLFQAKETFWGVVFLGYPACWNFHLKAIDLF